MKLFQQLLVAPAALGLLAPLSVSASEVNFDDISTYSNDNLEIDVNSFNQKSTNNLLAGGEGLVDSSDTIGGFSETTTASFGVDFVVGAEDGAASEAAAFGYQMGIGLSTSFTGEDSLDVTIDIGGATSTGAATKAGSIMGFQATNNALSVDGITYTFPLAGATVVVGDTTDVSAAFTGACVYSAFTDYMGNCGTGNSVGAGANGATVAVGYAFDSGLSIAAGLSSPETAIATKESNDYYGFEVAYSADNYGVAAAFASKDGGTNFDTTYMGINAFYVPDSEVLPSISVGYETEEFIGYYTGYFVGLTWDEVGAGSLSLGAGTSDNYTDAQEELMTYELSYSYPLNDGMTITPGVYIKEAAAGADSDTGVLVKTSFSF